MSFWVTFEDGSSGCVEAPIEHQFKSENWDERLSEIGVIASEIKGVAVTKVERLPYPASPRLNPQDWPDYGRCPSFCFSPRECAGSTSCPKRYSCVE